MSIRYAVYFIPKEGSLLASLGFSLLGRNPKSGANLKRPLLKNLTEDELISRTQKASQYGLHATLVAPFYASAGENTLLAALKDLLSGEKEIEAPQLLISALKARGSGPSKDSFAALVPEYIPPALSFLERKLVTNLNDLRDKNAAKKDRGPLEKRPQEYYQKYGYPFVLEEFLFHITLADAADERTLAALRDYFPDEALAPFKIDSLSLMRQRGEEPFELVAMFPLEA
jgi:hypothetical protein